MSRLPLDLSRAFDRFVHPRPLRVTETLGRREAGRYEVVDLEERRIAAVVLALRGERLELLAAGDASVAGIALLTRERLYFTDPKAESTEDRQSYVHYREQVFRVVADAMTDGNADYHAYDCLRYMDLANVY